MHAQDSWGHWWGRKHYSLEVVQHPLRARMCGFGDKDRRPLAPAAVAKMVVRREDSSLVDLDEVDSSFFLATVDLWSADGKREMNLVLHPSSSSDRYLAAPAPKQKKQRPPPATSPRSDHASPPSSHSTPGSAAEPPRPSLDPQPPMAPVVPADPFASPNYSYTPPDSSMSDPIAYPHPNPYPSPDSPDTWAFPHTAAHAPHAIHTHPLRALPRSMPAAPSAEQWSGHSTYRADAEAAAWPAADSSYQTPIHSQPTVYSSQDADPSNRPYHPAAQPDGREYHQWNQDSYAPSFDPSSSALYGTQAYSHHSPQTPYYPGTYSQSNPSSSASPPVPSHPLPRHVYTRTLVGPLSSNACRLHDENQIPGIFFLFQDLSVRTEGTFRLRLRLMNVGDSPAPEPGAQRVHTNVSPVLAQTFTDPFVVFSAKRFPGVPETTALSIAFGNQGQKLPLRNRHGAGKQGRRPHREDSEGSESSDDT